MSGLSQQRPGDLSYRAGDPRGDLVRELRGQLGSSVALASAVEGKEVVTFSCGVVAVDRLLPGGGLRHGMLVEWLAELPGCGAATLGLVAAREACRTGGVMVVLDRRQAFYPLAAAAWGVDPERLILVRPRTARDEIWAAVQALRSPVVAAVWAMIDRLDGRNFRRLQLAAEAGRTLGVLVRGASARGQPSWAEVRLGVGAGLRIGSLNPQSRVPLGCRNPKFFSPRSLHVSLLHIRGGCSGGSVWVEIDEAAHEVREARGAVSDRRSAVGQNVGPIADSRQPRASPHDTHPLPVVAELADPAARSHSARA
jgi:hypothetical protein